MNDTRDMIWQFVALVSLLGMLALALIYCGEGACL